MRQGWSLMIACGALGACTQPKDVLDGQQDNSLESAAPGAIPAQNSTSAPVASTIPPERPVDASLPEGPIDAKSAQGAGQVVQSYGALLEAGRFAQARRLWSDAGRASGLTEAEFADAYAKYASLHAEVGAPGAIEGAAGSLYVTVPLRLTGRLKDGARFDMAGPVTLRRVNDVPGASAEQRRWHIAQSDLKPRP